MKKVLCFIFSILISVTGFTSCKDESDSGEIALIVSEMYGTIKPVDIYEIKDGYMTTLGEIKYRKRVELQRRYSYCAYNYSKNKSIESYNNYLLSIDKKALKVTSEYIVPTAVTFKPSVPYTIYYSEYWGKKEEVLFISNISFHKTIHIKLEERKDTYRIMYYTNNSSGNIDRAICLDNIKKLDDYKKVVEVSKSDISRIEYII